MSVRGLGGVFIYAKDAAALVEWYRRHLGLEFQFEPSERSYYIDFVLPADPAYDRDQREVFAIRQAADPAALVTGQFVINWRVGDLNGMLHDLRAADVQIQREETYEYGSFAWLTDLEGNRLELFESAPR